MGLEQSILGKPFVEEDSLFARAFPAKQLASALPIILGSILFCLIVFNVGWSLVGAHPAFQAPKHRVVNDALQSCVIRHESGNTSVVVRGGHLCETDHANSADGSNTILQRQEPGATIIDVTALEECLNAAVIDSQSQEVDEVAKLTVPDWVLSELGSGISVECMVPPEASNLEGHPVVCAREADDEPCVPEDAPRVLYLPPVRVSVHCSTTYPDHEPALEVYAPWLEREALERLVHAMRTAAAELGEGAPVMLTWLECAKYEVTQSLQALIIRPACGSYMMRSLPGCPPVVVKSEQPPDVEGVLAMLRAHDRIAQDAAFAAELHRCAICLDDHLGSDGIRAPCGHWHCLECMKQMAATCLQARDPYAICCPQPDCRAQLDIETLQMLLDTTQMKQWDDLMLQRALMKMSDVVFCPRCEVAAIEHTDWAMCPGCSFAFCTLCYDSYHPGTQCATPEEKLRLLDERSRRMHGTATMSSAKEMFEHQRLRQQLADEAMVRKEAKSCPHCSAAIQKSGGCNKVVCAFCKGAMCWLCNAAIDGYTHFRTSACKLIDHAQELEWEREWHRLEVAHNQLVNPAQMVAPQQAEQVVAGMRCLQCGQFCIKVARNNHVKCVWCRADCCYACKSLLRGRRAIKEHFGVKKCPQHS